MRRAELIEACANVLKALQESKVREALASLLGHGSYVVQGKKREIDWEVILKSMRDYAVISSKFGTHENEVITTLGLERLTETKLWRPRPEQELQTDNLLRAVWRAVTFVEDHLSDFMNLIKQSPSTTSDDEASRLRVILIEEEGEASSPERLIKVLEGIKELYAVCASLEDAPQHGLSVVACDSGSDKSFDFFGLAKVVQGLKELLVSMWDKVAFHPAHKTEANYAAVAKALPILEKIHDLKEKGAMDASQAEQLRRKVIENAEKLLACGVVTPEINARTTFNPRQLMAPQVKMLTSGSPAAEEPKNGGRKAAPQLGSRAAAKATVPEAEIVVNVEDDEAEMDAEIHESTQVPLRKAFSSPAGKNLDRLSKDEQTQLALLMAKAEGKTSVKPKAKRDTSVKPNVVYHDRPRPKMPPPSSDIHKKADES